MSTDTPIVDVRPATAPRPVAMAAGGLWIAAGVATLLGSAAFEDGDDWVIPYIASAVTLVAASATTLWVAVRATAPSDAGTARRIGYALAVAVAALGLVITFVVPWAYVAWGVVQAVGHLALAATGRPRARWVAGLGLVLLGGVAVAITGVELGIGDPGSEGDHSQVQQWALAATTAAMAGVLFRFGRDVDVDTREA